MAGLDAPPSLVDEHDTYPYGWGIRREGDGTLPPQMFAGEHAPDDEEKLIRLKEQALFPMGEDRFRLQPFHGWISGCGYVSRSGIRFGKRITLLYK